MIENYKDLLNIVNDKSLSFDVETLGLRHSDPIYSATYARWGEKPTTHYMPLSKKVRKEGSIFGQLGYRKVFRQLGKTPRSSMEAFSKSFLGELDNTKFIVGHNLRYDYGALHKQMTPEAFENFKSRINHPDIVKKYNSMSLTNPVADPTAHVSVGMRSLAYKDPNYVGAYKHYLNYLNDVAVTPGAIGTIDTHYIGKLYSGLAAQAGLVSWKGGKAYGGTLENLAMAMNVGVGGAHTEMDPIITQHVLEGFMSGDIDRLATMADVSLNSETEFQLKPGINTIDDINRAGNAGLSSEGIRTLKMFKAVEDFKVDYNGQSLSLSELNIQKAIETHAVNENRAGLDEVIESFGISQGEAEARYNSINKNDKAAIFRRQQRAAEQVRKHVIDTIGVTDKTRTLGSKLGSTVGETLADSLLSKRTAKFAGIGAIAIGAATAYSFMTGGMQHNNSSRIEGLHPGDGVNKEIIQSGTDFGSGIQWMKNATSKAMEFITAVGHNLKESVKANKALTFGMTIPGFLYGYHKGKKEGGKISIKGFAGAMALDMADDMLIFGGPTIAKYIPSFEKMKPLLEHPLMEKAGVGFFGFTMGKLAGEIMAKARFSGFDDAYNTIEGLTHKGVSGATRKHNTDFGSGYQGPNPELEPEYNTAQDIYRYELMRASSIGLPEEELYKKVTQPDKEMSEYVAASASAGTALHQYMQSMDQAQGKLYDSERLVVNREAGVAGHIDEITAMGIGDIKTLDPGIYREVIKSGKYKPQHYAQVQFYLGATGQEHGYIKYVNRANINQQKVFQFDFNPRFYEAELAKVQRVRARVQSDIASGKLNKGDLPMTASLKTLEKADKQKETPLEIAQSIEEKRQTFKEEMAYLRETKRGMPSGGKGYNRIQQKQKEKREQGMFSTQGIGLQTWNNRSKHHVM